MDPSRGRTPRATSSAPAAFLTLTAALAACTLAATHFHARRLSELPPTVDSAPPASTHPVNRTRWWFPDSHPAQWPWTWRMDASQAETVADLFPCLDMDCDARRGPRLSSECHGAAIVRRAECRWACSDGTQPFLPACPSNATRPPLLVRDAASCRACMSSSPALDTDRVFCRRTPRVEPVPTLHARPLRTLADYLRRTPKPVTRVLLFGDSTMRDMFHEATKCEFAAFRDVEPTPGTHVGGLFPKQHPCMGTALHIPAIMSRRARDAVAQRDIVVDYAMVFRAPPADEDGVAALCAGYDAVLINWGLHYPKQAAEYRHDMNVTLRALRRCGPHVKLLFASHPAQHFDTPLGWYKGRRKFSTRCVPLEGKVDFDAEFEDVDVWTRAVREVAQEQGVYLAPPHHLWGVRDFELERRLAETGGGGGLVRFVPHMDWTYPMHAFHTKKLGDCTHYQYRRHINSIVWDAVVTALLWEEGGPDHETASGAPAPRDRDPDDLERVLRRSTNELMRMGPPPDSPLATFDAALGRLLAANASKSGCGGGGKAPVRYADKTEWRDELERRRSPLAEKARWYY